MPTPSETQAGAIPCSESLAQSTNARVSSTASRPSSALNTRYPVSVPEPSDAGGALSALPGAGLNSQTTQPQITSAFKNASTGKCSSR